MVTAAVTAVNVTPVTPDVKRGRGRPPGQASPHVSGPHVSGVKCSRGRPQIEKQPRGRPRVGTKKPPSMNNDVPTPVTNTTTTSTPTSRPAPIIGTVGEAKLVSNSTNNDHLQGTSDDVYGSNNDHVEGTNNDGTGTNNDMDDTNNKDGVVDDDNDDDEDDNDDDSDTSDDQATFPTMRMVTRASRPYPRLQSLKDQRHT